MKAVLVEPGRPDTLRLGERPEPDRSEDGLLVETVAVGICGTDHEIVSARHGAPPPGSRDLVIGHEALGRVLDAPGGGGFATGDLVAPVVRRPDPVPCACCARGRWDMCRNGLYSERGIKGLDGFACERFTTEAAFAVKVPEALGLRGVLVEPASVVAKAWRRIDDAAAINCLEVGTVLVTGAGPIGLLGAMLAAQRGLDVHVLDRAQWGPKPGLVEGLGARYHVDPATCPAVDAVLECTGAAALVMAVMTKTEPNGIVCLTGVSEDTVVEVDAGVVNRELVLENDVVLGSVNAALPDYEDAVTALAAAPPEWLDAAITRRVPLDRWREAYERRDGDVKTVLWFTDSLEA